MWKILLQFPSLPQEETYVSCYREKDPGQLEHCTTYSGHALFCPTSLQTYPVNQEKHTQKRKGQGAKEEKVPSLRGEKFQSGTQQILSHERGAAAMGKTKNSLPKHTLWYQQRRFKAILCLKKFSAEVSTL